MELFGEKTPIAGSQGAALQRAVTVPDMGPETSAKREPDGVNHDFTERACTNVLLLRPCESHNESRCPGSGGRDERRTRTS
jgi:hypothetical protein